MADLILLHTAADAERAIAFALAWPHGRVIPVAVGPHDERLSLGAHAILAALLTPATHDEAAFTAVLQLIAKQRRSAFLICDGVADPPQPVIACGAPILFAALDNPADHEKLNRAVELLARGHWLTSERRTEPEAPAPVQVAPRGRKSEWRKRREAQLTEEIRQRPPAVDFRPVRRMRRIGLVIGGLVGVAVVVAGLAPWAASVARRQSQERAEAAARLEAARKALAPPPAAATPALPPDAASAAPPEAPSNGAAPPAEGGASR
jgi:hypothetical protein